MRCVNVGNPDFFLLFVYGLFVGGVGGVVDWKIGWLFHVNCRFGKMAQSSFLWTCIDVYSHKFHRKSVSFLVQRMPLGSPLFSNHLQKIRVLQGILSSFLKNIVKKIQISILEFSPTWCCCCKHVFLFIYTTFGFVSKLGTSGPQIGPAWPTNVNVRRFALDVFRCSDSPYLTLAIDIYWYNWYYLLNIVCLRWLLHSTMGFITSKPPFWGICVYLFQPPNSRKSKLCDIPL